MADKSVLVEGSRYGWRGALVLPDEYFGPADSSPFPSSASDSTFTDITTTSFVAISDVLQVRVGSDGNLTFSGALSFEPLTLTNGLYNVRAIWRYRTVGGSWVDVGTEISATNTSTVTGGVLDAPGDIDVAASLSGLSVDTNYEVQLYARRVSASPANTITFSGTATVVGLAGGTDGHLKYWNGTSWGSKPLKGWNGTTWVPGLLKFWNGTTWQLSNG